MTNVITRQDTLIAYAATEWPQPAQEAVLRATGRLRHASRVAATLEAAKAESRRINSAMGDHDWEHDAPLLLLLDLFQSKSQRTGEMANLGKGRRQAADGDAWMGAAADALRKLVPSIGSVVELLPDNDGDFQLLPDDEVEQTYTSALQERWQDGPFKWAEYREQWISFVEYQLLVVCGIREPATCYGLTIQPTGTTEQWAAIVAHAHHLSNC